MSIKRSDSLRFISLISSAAIALCAPAAAAVAATSPQSPAPTALALSGTVTDARSEQVSGGVVTTPASTPAVKGAQIEVNGRKVATSTATGAFSFAYQDPGGGAVTVTVTAPGFGTYRLGGVTPTQTGDVLTVQLTGKSQALSAQAAPGAAPLNRASAAAPAATASNCGGYSSNTTAPSTIKVLEYSEHTSSGAPVAGTETGIYSVPFETYVEDVLPNEWIASWDAASLDAGAMAVKTYAWYWVNNWRGGSYNGTCYNVDDSIDYQRYIPGQSAASTDAAVAATWDTVMTESGAVFQASFQATLTGSTSEACGAGLSNYPGTLSQWGSQNCAADGDSWQTILGVYYPGVSLSMPSGSAVSSPVAENAAGTDVVFLDSTGAVVNDYYASGAWTGPAAIGGTARSDSPVIENADGTEVVFIDASGDVVNDYHDSAGWHGPAAIGGTARAGSGLAMSSDGTDVVFVNGSGAVVNDYHNASGWSGPAAIGGTARSDSPLVETANGEGVAFFDTAGNVVNDYVASTGGWTGPAAIGGTAQAGSGLAESSDGTDVVFVNGSGAVVNDYHNAGGWNGPASIGGTARAGSPLVESANGEAVVFFDAAGDVENDYVGASGGWTGPAAIGGTARTGSGLAESSDGTDVAFLNTNSAVVNDYHDAGGWNGPGSLGGTSR